jgi:hypothetical protein
MVEKMIKFTQEEIIKIKEIVLDEEKEEALKMLKNILNRIEEEKIRQE